MTPAAVVLGSLTIRGRPEQVSRARAFVRALAGPAAETAALLTSELVTNAVLHTSSGHGGTVTVVVSDVPDGLLVEVVDDGSPDGGPEVSGDRYAAGGHGLFLVEQLAARWGCVRDGAGTTVWFQVAAGSDPALDGQLRPLARTDNWARRPGTGRKRGALARDGFPGPSARDGYPSRAEAEIAGRQCARPSPRFSVPASWVINSFRARAGPGPRTAARFDSGPGPIQRATPPARPQAATTATLVIFVGARWWCAEARIRPRPRPRARRRRCGPGHRRR